MKMPVAFCAYPLHHASAVATRCGSGPDTTSEDLAAFEAAINLPKERVIRHAKGHPHYQKCSRAVAAVIDQLICAQAAWFIGTKTSLFTATIVEERELAGKSYESSRHLFGQHE
eukprot:SAG31_NODE_4609_length_3098_cov_2.056019_4_plen_114_part_00